VACLAAWPLVNAFLFFFRSGGAAFQEVGVALLGAEGEHRAEVRRAAGVLAAAFTLLLLAVLATPLAGLWYRRVVGIEAGLLPFALVPSRVLILLPAMEVILSCQRSRWILARRTRVVSWATGLELGGIALWMSVLVFGMGLRGTLAAALALTLGRLGACAFLWALRDGHPHPERSG
jgi:hypothetical protein